MEFVVGDKIVFKRENQRGIVVKLLPRKKLLVRNTDDFEVIVTSNEVLPFDPSTDKASAYGLELMINKDVSEQKNISEKRKRVLSSIKIDLHIELLIENHCSLTNSEIVNIQLRKCEQELNKVFNSNITRAIIVHGIGAGVLREEVHKLLDHYRLRYYLSTDGGSTEVMI